MSSSVAVRPSAQVSPSSRSDRESDTRSSADRATTPRVRPAQPAQPAASRKSTSPTLPPQREPALSPNASGSSASAASAASATAGGADAPPKPGKSNSVSDKRSDKWVESTDYAYEYVPVPQKREGRKNISYELLIRQQPMQARMCGVGEKSDRRPVDPTPIIQLKVMTSDGEEVTPLEPRGEKAFRRQSPSGNGTHVFMQNPYYFLFACLVGGDDQDAELHVIDDGRTRFLTGTPVSSLYHLKDIDNKDAAFFVFPDLGVRKEGRYKLKLTLFEIVDEEVYYCTTVHTSTFSVYSAKKFPGMSKATELSRTFAEQGLKIRVRKDPRPAGRNKPKRKSSAQSDDDDAYGNAKRQRHLTHPGYAMETRGFQPDVHYGSYPPPGPYGYPPYGHGQMPPPPPPAFEGYPRPASSGGAFEGYPRPASSGGPPATAPGYNQPYYPPSYGYGGRPRHSLPPNHAPEAYGYGPPPPYDTRYDRHPPRDPRDPRDMRDPRDVHPREMSLPPREIRPRDPREAHDPREMYHDRRDPHEMPMPPRDPREVSLPPRDPREISHPPRDPRDPRDPREVELPPRELHPREMSLPPHPREMSLPPRDLRDMRDPRDVRDPRDAHDPRVDPRADPRVDPRADPRAVDPRLDPRADPRMVADPRVVDPRAVDPRLDLRADPRADPRAVDPRMDPRFDPRAAELHGDPREHMYPPRGGSPSYRTPPRSAGGAHGGPPPPLHHMNRPPPGPPSRGNDLRDPRDARDLRDPRADPRDPRADPRYAPGLGPPNMRPPPLGSRIDGPPSLGAYGRDPRDEHPGAWADAERPGSHHSSRPSSGIETKPPSSGRMGLGHLVD